MEHLLPWLSLHRWMALAGGMLLLSLYLLAADLVPRAASAYALFNTWSQQADRIASAKEGAAEEVLLGARRLELQEQLSDLYVSLPRSDQISTLVQVLQENAEATKVGMQEIRPSERSAFDGYDALPFQVVILGPFHRVSLFISRIEQSAYIIKVNRIHIERVGAQSDMLRADLALSVIVLNEQEDAS